MFNGLLTPEQLDGLRLLVTPFQTTWFNVTHHRVTAEPSQGVTCFSCHVNGHTNGAIELAPDSRPNYARLRVDTPTMRGNYAQLLFSSKRSIRTMDHFAEVEEYFDGDTAMLAAIGGRDPAEGADEPHGRLQRASSTFPPAPKLDVLNRLDPRQGHARRSCAARRSSTARRSAPRATPPVTQFTDNTMHDLQVERFYAGPARGADQDVPAARHQGLAAVLPRRPAADARGRRSSSSTSCCRPTSARRRSATSWRTSARCRLPRRRAEVSR